MVLNVLIASFAFVKHIATILLSLWISLTAFLPKSDTHCLGDMGNLLKHFAEHQRQENISFWQFLWLHYTHTEHQKQDQKHKNLPFHHLHAECVHLAVLSFVYLEIIPYNPPTPLKEKYFDCPTFYHFQPIDESFQPPKDLFNTLA